LTEYLNFLFENNLFTKTQDILKIAQQYHEEVWVDIFAIKTNYALEDTEKAQYYIAEALEKEDLTTIEKKGIYYWEAKLAFDEGNLEIAKEKLTSLKELDRFNPFYYLLMGEIQYQEGDFENAKDTLELAIEYDLGEGVSGNAEKALARID
jgi:tetratricopeptide (TPR) repeat protein